MKVIRQILISMFVLLMPVAAVAQDVAAMAPPQGTPVYAPAQLEQMLAPVALYPDPLLAQILMASTYPLELVEASRWLANPANAGLQGDQLAAALEQQPWDPSVKSVVAVPQVLRTLNDNIEWTEQVGDAFLSQQADVMNAVQNLRIQAQQAGALQSTPQQIVTQQGSDILIQPANPNVVYVPYYNPDMVYGSWAYPDYQPYYFSGYPAIAGAALGFVAGVAIVDSLWGWNHWDWRGHRIDIDNARFARLNEGRPPLRSGSWHYDPGHRHGVPFTSTAVRARMTPNDNRAVTSHASFRGYDVQRPAATPAVSRPQQQMQRQEFQQHQTPQQAMPQRQEFQRPAVQAPAAAPQMQQMRAQPQVLRPAPQQQAPRAAPVFESFSRGPEVRQQQQRGAQSRAPAPMGNRGGGNNQEHERR